MSYTLLLAVLVAQSAWQKSICRAEGPLPLKSHQTSGCYGNGNLQRDFINAECQHGERVAMYTIQHASKPRSTTCPLEMLNGTLQECCVPAVGDCSFRLPHNNTRDFFTSCTGYRRCSPPVRIPRSRLVTSHSCSTTKHLEYSNYLIANYYCIPESSIVYIDDTPERTQTSLYLAYMMYPAVTNPTNTHMCYISTSCEEVIHIKAIDLHLNCSSWMELVDDGEVTNMSCIANNDYYIRTVYTSSSNALSIRTMGVGPVRFWLYIQASSPNSTITITCGHASMGYTHNVCSSSNMDISSAEFHDVSTDIYISTYSQLQASSPGDESDFVTYYSSEKDLEPSATFTIWPNTAENSFEYTSTSDYGNMETSYGDDVTESGYRIHISTSDGDTSHFEIVSSYESSGVSIGHIMSHSHFDERIRGSGSNTYGVVSESSGTSDFNKTTLFSEIIPVSSCLTPAVTVSVKQTIHVTDTSNFIAPSGVHPVSSADRSKSLYDTPPLPSALPTDVTQSLTTRQFSSSLPTPGSQGPMSAKYGYNRQRLKRWCKSCRETVQAAEYPILGGAIGSFIGVVIIILGIIFRKKICNNKVAADKDVEDVDDSIQEDAHEQNDVSDSTNLSSGMKCTVIEQIPPLVTQQLQIPRNHIGGSNPLARLPPLHGAVRSGLLNNASPGGALQTPGHTSETYPSASASLFSPRTLPALRILQDTPTNDLPDIVEVPRPLEDLGIYANKGKDSTCILIEEAAKKKTKKRKKRKHNKNRSERMLEGTEIMESSPFSHHSSGENIQSQVDALDSAPGEKKRKRKHKKRKREKKVTSATVDVDPVEEVDEVKDISRLDI